MNHIITCPPIHWEDTYFYHSGLAWIPGAPSDIEVIWYIEHEEVDPTLTGALSEWGRDVRWLIYRRLYT